MAKKGLRCSKFNPDVLKETDSNGDCVGLWCTATTKPTEALCTVCDMIINCRQHGISAVKRHASSLKHIEKCRRNRNEDGMLKKSTQLRFTIENPMGSKIVLSHRENVLAAETLFAFSIAANNVPYKYADLSTNIFPRMFSDSKIAKDFSCRRNKLSYMISDGIGLHIKEELITEITKNNTVYSIQIDETPVLEKRVTQLDVNVRFFSEKQQEVVSHHLQSFEIGHSRAEDILRNVCDALTELPKDKLLNFFSDGPNVMKSLKKKLKEMYPNLIDIGFCNLHVIHNAFSKGLQEFCGDIETLMIDLYYFFKQSAVQSEDLRQLQIKCGFAEHILLRHVENRWLTLHNSVDRFIEQFEVLRDFFKSKHAKEKSVRLNRISKIFATDKALLAKALFIRNVASLFTNILNLFQRDEPLVHIVYDELTELLKKVMGRFLHNKFFLNISGHDLVNVEIEKGDNWLKKVELGLDTEQVLSTLSSSNQNEFRLGARSFYIACAKYLMKMLPLDNKILENLKCLHPLYISEQPSLSCIKHLAAAVPFIVPSCEVSSLRDEWISLQAENVNFTENIAQNDESDSNSENELQQIDTNCLPQRLDHFWWKIFALKNNSGAPKYKLVTALVKGLLCLSHGNADCERGFSLNKRLLDNRTNLNIHSINGLRQIKSHLKRLKGDINKIHITPALLKAVKSSRQTYEKRIEVEKSQEKRKYSSPTIVDQMREKVEEEKRLKNQLTAAQAMLCLAEKNIYVGLRKKDLVEIESGQILLKDAREKIPKILKDIEKNKEQLSQLSNEEAKKKRKN